MGRHALFRVLQVVFIGGFFSCCLMELSYTDSDGGMDGGAADGGASDGWVLRFADDFNRVGIGEDWLVVDGSWRIQSDMLVGGVAGAPPSPHAIRLTRSVFGPVRLEFDAISDENVYGINGVLRCGVDIPESCYRFGFGMYGNTATGLLIEGEEVLRLPEPVVVPEHLHKVICEVDQHTLRLTVDSYEVYQHRYDTPLDEQTHPFVGLLLSTWARIDNVKVYTKTSE